MHGQFQTQRKLIVKAEANAHANKTVGHRQPEKTGLAGQLPSRCTTKKRDKMNKVILIATTLYFIFFLQFLPTNARSKKSFLNEYSKNPSPEVVEKVYDNLSEQLKITLWSFLGMYGACIALGIVGRKKSKETKNEPTNN